MGSIPFHQHFRVAKEGYSIILFLFAVTSAVFFLNTLFFFLCVAFLFLVIWFFRDPERKIAVSESCILSPADGQVIGVEVINKAPYLLGSCTKISIFLSIFDAHINRSPIEGKINFIKYSPGAFHAAFAKKAYTENESNWIGIAGSKFTVLMRQISGAIARRIVCTVREEQSVDQGQRVGMIKFGSGTEVYIPLDFNVKTKVGQRVKAGLTILASLN